MTMLQLSCCYPAEPGYFFVIAISADSFVKQLEKQLFHMFKEEEVPGPVRLRDLQLYYTNVPILPEETMFQRARDWLREQQDSRSCVLRPTSRLTDIFPTSAHTEGSSLHIIIANISSERSLNCLVHGEDPNKIFTIRINFADKNVNGLKSLIKQALPELFTSVPATDLQLIPVSILADGAQGPDLSNLDVSPVRALGPLVKLSHAFPDPKENHLNVIVLRPPLGMVQPNPPCRSKLSTLSPSSVARASTYVSMHMDGRPEREPALVHPALIYPPFGTFEDVAQGRLAIDLLLYYPAVDAFADAMCKFYADENRRRDAGLPLLNHIFTMDETSPRLAVAAIGNYTSDGHSVDIDGTHAIVVEFKSELTGITSHPQVEGAGYCAHLQKRVSTMIDMWRIPSLVITIVGTAVQFHAILRFGPKNRVSYPLTSGLSCIQSASGGKQREELYRAFAAASQLQRSILSDFQNELRTPSPPILTDSLFFPPISMLTGLNGTVDFTIYSFHPKDSGQPDRHLFLAHMAPSRTLILVKFTRKYSPELHQHCFQLGHAPKLLAHERLPGDWHGVAMEWVSSAQQISSPEQENEIRNFVTGLHQRGFVHGDLRDVNILSDGGRFLIVDFDWGGKIGEAQYPPNRSLHPELLEGRVEGDLTIRPHDDLRILGFTMRKF